VAYTEKLLSRRILQTKYPERKSGNKLVEVQMLCSAIRRLEISTAVFVVAEDDAEAQFPEELLLTTSTARC
jgi:DNA-binding protein YbaB